MTEKTLQMKEFRVKVMTVPSNLEMLLAGAKIRTEWIVIKGYTLKDAKRRAGIQ